MLKIKEYVKVNSLEEAYELNQKKSSRVSLYISDLLSD